MLQLLHSSLSIYTMMLHPSFEIEKTYEVTISGQITEEEVATLRKGVVIDGIKTSRAKVTLLRYNVNKNISFLTVTIHEGRNRQVRKMFETLNYEVTRLNRIKEGPLTLGTLQPGQYRKLKPVEVKSLKKYLETK